MEPHKNTLNYWYNLEFFSPFWPERTKHTTNYKDAGKPLPWFGRVSTNTNYDVYLGSVQTQELIIEMVKAIGENDELLDKDSSKSCLCGFKVTGEGKYVEESFTIATFVWAMAKITNEKNLRTGLSGDELEQFNKKVDEYLKTIDHPLQFEDLQYLFINLVKKLNVTGVDFLATVIKKEVKNEDENSTDNTTDMMSSFYISDINMIRSQVRSSDRIVSYINALLQKETSKIEIDRDVEQMQQWLTIEKYPIGKWPSVHSPSLMQQLAINISIADNANPSNIFSVNGPPGTGKTTLLKEVIAHYIVERALKLVTYKEPDDAFKKVSFKSPQDYYYKYNEMENKLKKYSIIVASNNNAAVENISKELPIAKDVKEAHTNLFNVDNQQEDIYFTALASELLNEDCWGLVSARLGKKSNLNELAEKLWFGSNSYLNYSKNSKLSWQEAKSNFNSVYTEFLNCRQEIEKKLKKIESLNELTLEKGKLEANLVELQQQVNLKQLKMQHLQNQLMILSQTLSGLKEDEKLLQSRIPWYKKYFSFLFKKDALLDAVTQNAHAIDENLIEISKSNIQLSELEKDCRSSISKLEQQTKEYEQVKAKLILLQKQCEDIKKEFGETFADDAFWSNIERNKKSQLKAPWTTKEFDELREKLFYAALQLHKAFVLESNAVKDNLRCLVAVWKGDLNTSNKNQAYNDLLNTLFLVVPVVSSTFASISTFLKYIGKEQLGTLIIDESGQATPYSALGAIWRTQKAIVVGDPLQVEPVLTIPKQLISLFAKEFNVGLKYRSAIVSVQQLADTINRYGGYRETTDGPLWLGCPLVVHCRCTDPMFSISNETTYNNRMFIETQSKEVTLLFEKSYWVDIRGKENGGKDHYVHEQGEFVVKKVIEAFNLHDNLPNLYIISPFKSVIYGLKQRLKRELVPENGVKYSKDEISEWIKKSCGTVHTFQGKEANEVIFLLGCDAENGGGAVTWASGKPNILNVAVTRAKYRIVIVGDAELWGKEKYFDVAYKYLKQVEKVKELI